MVYMKRLPNTDFHHRELLMRKQVRLAKIQSQLFQLFDWKMQKLSAWYLRLGSLRCIPLALINLPWACMCKFTYICLEHRSANHHSSSLRIYNEKPTCSGMTVPEQIADQLNEIPVFRDSAPSSAIAKETMAYMPYCGLPEASGWSP